MSSNDFEAKSSLTVATVKNAPKGNKQPSLELVRQTYAQLQQENIEHAAGRIKAEAQEQPQGGPPGSLHPHPGLHVQNGFMARHPYEPVVRSGSASSVSQSSSDLTSTSRRSHQLQIVSPPTAGFAWHLLLTGMLPNFRWDLVLSAHEPESTAHTADDEAAVTNPEAGYPNSAPKLKVRMLGARKILAIALSLLTWVYSLMVLVLTTALWLRVIAFQGFRNAPAENIGFGAYFFLPIANLIRGWYCFAYRKDHERYVWELFDQEEAELRAIAQVEQLEIEPAQSADGLEKSRCDCSQNGATFSPGVSKSSNIQQPIYPLADITDCLLYTSDAADE